MFKLRIAKIFSFFTIHDSKKIILNLKTEASKKPCTILCTIFQGMYKKNLDQEYQKLRKK